MVAPFWVVELGWVSSPGQPPWGSLLLALPCQAAGREITHLVHAPVVPILLATRREPPGPGGCKETRGRVRWG